MIKKLLTIALFCLLSHHLKAQYTTQIICGPNLSPAVNYVYLGSITLPFDNYSNCQKLQVDILGSSWDAGARGQTTFYIANRGGLAVSQVVTGGIGFTFYSLVAYQNGNNTDFYLSVNSAASYYSFAIRSYFMAGLNSTASMVPITTQTTVPTGTSISVPITVISNSDQSGNISIGTNNIDSHYKLSVGGPIRATEIKVESGWADYVFVMSYVLRPLSEVNDYIQKNKHLPDVPSALEVKQNGVFLGESNTLLLKKVEELTLYLIEKDKQVSQQEKEIILLKKEIEEIRSSLNAKSKH